jgi:hypothetical protein
LGDGEQKSASWLEKVGKKTERLLGSDFSFMRGREIFAGNNLFVPVDSSQKVLMA